MSIRSRLILIAALAAIATLTLNLMLHQAISITHDNQSLVTEIANVEVGMLTQRRHEKDFLARQELKYHEAFLLNQEGLLTQIASLQSALAANDLDTTMTEELSRLMVEYGQHFNAIVDIHRTIGLGPKDGLYGHLRDSVHNVEEDLQSIDEYQMLSDMLQLRRNEKDFMLRSDLKYVKKFEDNYQRFFEDLDTLLIPADVRESVTTNMQRYRQDFLNLSEAYQQRGLQSDQGLRGQMRDTVHQTEALLAKLRETIAAEAEAAIDRENLQANIISVVINIVLVLIILQLGRSILRPIKQLGAVMEEVRNEADLSLRCPLDGKDEVSQMAQNFNLMQEQFQHMMKSLAGSAAQLAAASEELSAVTDQTNTSIQHQRLETDQVATAINEMNSTVQEVANSAAAAAEAAQSADRDAINGQHVVQETVSAINQLAYSVEETSQVIQQLDSDSESIGSVLDVIRGIAEQTNLLALNAAIEAARAGEQGRGFAVVADEVRTLASRTQVSTQEIQEMIERLQNGAKQAVTAMESGRRQAQAGVEQAQQAGQSLEAITRAVSAINDMNTQIASAAEEQSAVAEELNRNVVTISQIADQTSDGAQVTLRSSEDLSTLANELKKSVAQFKV